MDSAEADEEVSDEADDDVTGEADDDDAEEADAGAADEAEDEDVDERFAPPDFEADMHDIQEELGEDWILRFSVQGGDAWLTAEKEDGSHRLEAPTPWVLMEAVELLRDGGGR